MDRLPYAAHTTASFSIQRRISTAHPVQTSAPTGLFLIPSKFAMVSQDKSFPNAHAKIILPDVFSHVTFPLRHSRHTKQVTVESKQWLFHGGHLSENSRRAFHGLKAGPLTSMCYANAAYPQLRVCCDFINWLFHLDDVSDEMNDQGTTDMASDIMNTLYHPTSYQPVTRVGVMTREYVSCAVIIESN